MADPERVALVFANLITNAIRHTPSNGEVWVRARPTDGSVRFEVTDTGAGIPKEYQPRLFDKFFRVPGVARRWRWFGPLHRQGDCARAWRGYWGEERRRTRAVPSGSRCPTRQQVRQNKEPSMTKPQARILVVDDERNIRKNFSMVLEAAGYAVDTAGDGEEALTKSKEQYYDIAFVDLQMPKMGGLELTRFLRGLSRTTAVVILTAYGSVASAVEAMKLGATDFLEKPFDPKAIQRLVEEILVRKQLGSGGSVEDLLHLAELARKRKAYGEARAYLKTAMLRELMRPEPYYRLGSLSEEEGDMRQAAHYYYMALDVRPHVPARTRGARTFRTNERQSELGKEGTNSLLEHGEGRQV